MNKLLTGLLVIIIGVVAIGMIDSFSEGLMTSTETVSQTETDYIGTVSDIDLTKNATSISETQTANDICLSADENFLAISWATASGLKIYEWNDTNGQYELLDGADFTAPAGTPYGCAFSPDGTLFMVSTTTGSDIFLYDISGSTFTASTDTPAESSDEVARLFFVTNTKIAYSSTTTALDFRIMTLSGTSWNNNAFALNDMTASYDMDFFVNEGNNEYYAVTGTVAPYLSIVKNTTELALTNTPNVATYGIGWSPDGTRLATGGNNAIFVYSFTADDTSAMTVDTSPTVGEIYDILWVTDSIFYANGSTGSAKYVYDGTSWDIDATGTDFDAFTKNTAWATTHDIIYGSANNRLETYDPTLTTTGDSVTLDNTPDVINSVTHNGVSKTYTLVDSTLTPDSPELTGDLVINYDHTVTGDYPLLNIVPIVFAVTVIAFVVSLIYFKRD